MEKIEMICINCPLGCMLTVERDAEGGRRLLLAAKDIYERGESMYEIAESELFYLRTPFVSVKSAENTNGAIFLNGRVKQRAAAGR